MANIIIDNRPISAIATSHVPLSDVSVAEVDIDGVNIAEINLNHYLIQLCVFSEYQTTVKKKIHTACGLNLPPFGNKTENESLTILATHPNKWLLISQSDPRKWLADIVDNVSATINNQSSAYAVIEMTGKDTKALVQRLCFIDLDKATPIVVTQLATDYNGVVERIGEHTDDKASATSRSGYRLYITRSFAKSFWDMLLKI